MINATIQAAPKHPISPYLYMQFMEPLGAQDAAMDAGWDFWNNCWKPVLINKVKELGPKMVRFGGCFSSYYHWREGVGPRNERVQMLNQDWEALYHNQMGTHEVMDFCRQVNAEPLFCVNFESDGRMDWAYPSCGGDRLGTAEEAAQWVAYCNHPDNPERLAHGIEEPYNIRFWQLGNETSYTKRGHTSDYNAELAKRFADAMRREDPTLTLIGWGDAGEKWRPDNTWAKKIAAVDGIDLVAFHHHFDSGLPNSPLTGNDYRIDPDNTWLHLMHAHKSLEDHIAQMRADCGGKHLAMTEGHYVLPGRNRCEVLSTWGAGVSYARCLNVIHRNSDLIDIATMADFFGNVWQVNAILLAGRKKQMIAYFQPVATVMHLFGKYQGEQAIDVSIPGVDAVGSRTGNKLYLHLVNTDLYGAKEIQLNVDAPIADVKMYGVTENILTEVTPCNPDVFAVQEWPVEGTHITLPKASVAAVEITLA